MKRIVTLAAAAMIAAPAFAAEHAAENETMTMLQTKLADALSSCDVEMADEAMMELTMAQISGIIIAADSEDGGQRCEKIESISRDAM